MRGEIISMAGMRVSGFIKMLYEWMYCFALLRPPPEGAPAGGQRKSLLNDAIPQARGKRSLRIMIMRTISLSRMMTSAGSTKTVMEGWTGGRFGSRANGPNQEFHYGNMRFMQCLCSSISLSRMMTHFKSHTHRHLVMHYIESNMRIAYAYIASDLKKPSGYSQ